MIMVLKFYKFYLLETKSQIAYSQQEQSKGWAREGGTDGQNEGVLLRVVHNDDGPGLAGHVVEVLVTIHDTLHNDGDPPIHGVRSVHDLVLHCRVLLATHNRLNCTNGMST